MKKKSLFLLPLALLIACGKKSSDSTDSSELNPLSGTLSESKASREVIRRVFDVTSKGDLENPEIKKQYISSLNKRIIEFRLTNGQKLLDDCYENSGSQKANITTSTNQDIVQIQVELSAHKIFPTIVNCPVLENEQMEIKNFKLVPDLYLKKEDRDLFLRNFHNYSFEHIVFEEGTSYILNDKIILNAKKIVFNNALITTFPRDQYRADNEQDGVSGGELILNTLDVLGSVNFKLYGQDGGEITRRPPAQPALPEDPSLNGNCKKSCSGKPGLPGLKGLKGYNGKNGGDSGSFTLKFTRSLGLDLVYEVLAGSGSMGGQGGDGGAGQPGGWNDQMDTSDPIRQCGRDCFRIPYEAMRSRENTRAASGAHGAPGDRGDRGRDGEIIPSKIIHKNETSIFNYFTELNLPIDYE